MPLYATYHLKQQPPRAIASNSMLENFHQATNEEANLMRMYNLAQHSNMSKKIMLPTKKPITILESSKDARERTYPLASIPRPLTLLERAANRKTTNAARNPIYNLTQEFEQLSLTTYEDMQPKPTIPNCFWLLNEDDQSRLKRRWEKSRIDDRFPNFESKLAAVNDDNERAAIDRMNGLIQQFEQLNMRSIEAIDSVSSLIHDFEQLNLKSIEDKVEDKEIEDEDEDKVEVKVEVKVEDEIKVEVEVKVDNEKVGDKKIENTKVEDKNVEVERVKVEQVEDEQVKDEVKKVEVEQLKVEEVKVEQVETKQVEVEQIEETKVEVKNVEDPKVEVKNAEVEKAEYNKVKVKQVEGKQVEFKKVEVTKVEENRVRKLDKPHGQGSKLKKLCIDDRLPNVETRLDAGIKNESNQSTNSEVKVDAKTNVKKEVVKLKAIGESSLEKLSLSHNNQKEKETKDEDEDVEKNEETSSNQCENVPNESIIEDESYLNKPKGKENTKWNQKWIRFVTLRKQKPKSDEINESVGKQKSPFKAKLKNLFQRKRKWVPFETTGEVEVLFDADDYKDEEDTKLGNNISNGNESTSNEGTCSNPNTENETTVNEVDVSAVNNNNEQENNTALDAREPEGEQPELTRLDAVLESPAADTPPLNAEDADVATKVNGSKRKTKVMKVLKKLIKPFKSALGKSMQLVPLLVHQKRSSSKRKKNVSTEPASDADKATEDVTGAGCDLPKQAEVEDTEVAPLVLKPIIKIRDDTADSVTGAKRKVQSKHWHKAFDAVKASFKKTFRRKTSKVRFADTNECFIVERYDHKRKEEPVPQLLENEGNAAVTEEGDVSGREEGDATENAQSLLKRCVGRPSTGYNATPSLINDEQDGPRSDATLAEEPEEEDIENLDSYRPPPTDEKLDIDPQTGQFFGSRGFTNDHYKPRKNRANYSKRPTIHQLAHEKMKSEQIAAAQATGRWVQNPKGNWIYEDSTKWWLNGDILDYRTFWRQWIMTMEKSGVRSSCSEQANKRANYS
ncbi:hypothetical protein I9W82_003155 [Candida metapsilosis]|uniref:Uncharacterized protein n=1 Tax=Candida metapsilosis TaxID=273372 RepID=A0A8H7ZHW2_9ASCO|nr:hypothetical protein I9W82_003155 [Candida metapsilosis]